MFLPVFTLFCLMACKTTEESTLTCELNKQPSIEYDGTVYVFSIRSTRNNLASAEEYCSTATVQNCTGWSLPTEDELNALYLNRASIGIDTTYSYWSSTKAGEYNVWVQDFATGQQGLSLQYPGNQGHNCVCIQR